MTGEVPEML